jgi:hypothetical protein
MSKAYQVRNVHLLNQQRDPLARFRRPVRERARDRRPGMSETHLERIRLLPCCISGRLTGVEAHHLKAGPARGERGIGLKSADWWAVPLHWELHAELERLGSRREPGWFGQYGLDPYPLAQALWGKSHDRDPWSVSNMLDVLRAHMIDGANNLCDLEARGE